MTALEKTMIEMGWELVTEVTLFIARTILDGQIRSRTIEFVARRMWLASGGWIVVQRNHPVESVCHASWDLAASSIVTGLCIATVFPAQARQQQARSPSKHFGGLPSRV